MMVTGYPNALTELGLICLLVVQFMDRYHFPHNKDLTADTIKPLDLSRNLEEMLTWSSPPLQRLPLNRGMAALHRPASRRGLVLLSDVVDDGHMLASPPLGKLGPSL